MIKTDMKRRTSRIITATVAVVLTVLAVAVGGGSTYMLNYSLSPDLYRADTAARFSRLKEAYPEVRGWLDSLYAAEALRDTFVAMPRGERHHAYMIKGTDRNKTAVIVHGWRDCAIDFMYIGRLYNLMGYNIMMPDLHAHGLSEGDAIGMGWQERYDVLHWMQVAAERFGSTDFVVHGVSMGAATTMNVSGEKMPQCVKTVRFIEDCGYTSVWDEFAYKLKDDFHLPAFPLMYTTSMLCRLRYGWSFEEASPLDQVAKCPYPMLFIHGDNDHFVPSPMVYPLYEAKSGDKDLWITKGTAHALSYHDYPEEYARRVAEWVATDN